MSVDELFSAASSLPPMERMLLSDLLRDTVPPEAWPELSDQWLSEIERRSAEFDAGKITAAAWSEVRERARRQAQRDG